MVQIHLVKIDEIVFLIHAIDLKALIEPFAYLTDLSDPFILMQTALSIRVKFSALANS